MLRKKCMLNNMRMDRIRKETMYQAVIIDLAVNGAIDKDKAEDILGYEIPASIRPLSNGRQMKSRDMEE